MAWCCYLGRTTPDPFPAPTIIWPGQATSKNLPAHGESPERPEGSGRGREAARGGGIGVLSTGRGWGLGCGLLCSHPRQGRSGAWPEWGAQSRWAPYASPGTETPRDGLERGRAETCPLSTEVSGSPAQRRLPQP